MDIWNKEKLANANKELATLRHYLAALQSKVNDLEANKERITVSRDELKDTLDRMRALADSQPPMISIEEAKRWVEEKEVVIAELKLQLETTNQRYELQATEQQRRSELEIAAKEIEILAGRKAYWDSVRGRMLSDVQILIEQKSIGFPWLAEALAEYYANLDKLYAEHLRSKSRPALVQADRIRDIAKEKSRFKKEYTIMKYVLRYYESLFPWLRDYVGLNAEELIAEANEPRDLAPTEDPVQQFLSSGEFQRLKPAERNQTALDRYWQTRKTNWQVGRDYERYVGYLYEQQGFKVQYFGIERGLEDLGRDLVCIKNDLVEIVQCKYWSKTKGMVIREAHVNQLFGTTVKHYIDSMSSTNRLDLDAFMRDYDTRIKATMVTSTNLSDEAMRFADALGITVRDDLDMDRNYPCIKCNISQQTGEKIYHLPFDQQYDKVIIDCSHGEFYANTVVQAEKHGFRRAWRWQGSDNH